MSPPGGPDPPQPGRAPGTSILIEALKGVPRSQAATQAAIYTASSIANGLLAVVSTALLARHMSTSRYGVYAFANGVIMFVALFYDFGLAQPSARLIARAGGAEKRRMAGAALVMYVPIGIAFSLTLALLGGFSGHALKGDTSAALLAVAPVAFVFPFVSFSSFLAQGSGRFHLYGIMLVIAQAVIASLIGATLIFHVAMSPSLALLLRAAGYGFGGLALIVMLRPLLSRLRGPARRLVHDARRYGFRVFVGRSASIATYQMDVVMLGLLSSTHSVAYYTLAGSIAATIGYPAIGIAGALFSRMTSENRLDPRWIAGVCGLAAASVLLVSVLAPLLVPLIFSDRYSRAGALIPPLAMAEGVRAVTTLFNSFLSAHGRGRDLQTAGVSLAGANIVLNLSMIPTLGAQGAAWASLLALVGNLGVYVYLYRVAIGRTRRRTWRPFAAFRRGTGWE